MISGFFLYLISKDMEFRHVRMPDLVYEIERLPSAQSPTPIRFGRFYDGRPIRVGDLRATVWPRRDKAQVITISAVDANGRWQSGKCRSDEGGACTILISNVDFCSVARVGISIRVLRNAQVTNTYSRPPGEYVVAVGNFLHVLAEQPGREVVRENLSDSSVCN